MSEPTVTRAPKVQLVRPAEPLQAHEEEQPGEKLHQHVARGDGRARIRDTARSASHEKDGNVLVPDRTCPHFGAARAGSD